MTDHWDDDFERTIRRSLPYLAPEAPLEPDADLGSLGLDSVQMVGVMIALEDAFDIELPDEVLVAETFATAGNLWRAVSAARSIKTSN